MVLISLWLRVRAGEYVSPRRWLVGAGLWIVIGILLYIKFWIESKLTRYIEFRGDKIYLSQKGTIAL